MVARRLAKKEPEFDDVLRAASGVPGATLQELCTQNRRIGYLYKRSAWVRELISHAAAIEGLPYGFVRAKRTLIISPTPLREFLGHTVNPDTGDRFVQSTRDSFPIGSISRIDVSTLNALAVCARCGVTGPAGEGLPWDRGTEYRDIYRMIQHGDVAGVFLLESELITRLARKFEIGSFDDLLRFLALMRIRRGGLSLAERVDAYRDPNREVAPAPDAIAHLLEFTNGWILFDDQLRDIVGIVTGLDSLNAAQLVRRFARQEPAELAALRREFMTFAVEYGTPMDTANASFARVLRAAGGTVARQQIISEALIVSTMLYLKKRETISYFTELVNV
jgi:DNA polymerase III alpha subunit